jgi:hypothetical protein
VAKDVLEMDRIISMMIQGHSIKKYNQRNAVPRYMWLLKDLSKICIGTDKSNAQTSIRINSISKVLTYCRGYVHPELTVTIQLRNRSSIVLEYASIGERALWKRGIDYLLYMETQNRSSRSPQISDDQIEEDV